MDRISSDEPPGLLRLTLPSRAENVGVVRHALAGLAEALGMDDEGIGDLKTIVTEACMNVVVHAYGNGEGPLEVSAGPDQDGMTLVVRDYGGGIRPQPTLDEPSLRLGMALIAALASSFEIRGGHGKGTEIRVRVDLERNGGGSREQASPEAEPLAGTTISVAAGALVAPIVARVISSLAARADLSVDRLSDAVLLGDAISAHGAEDFHDDRVQIGIEDVRGAIEVRIGPLREGAAQRILDAMELPALGASLQSLADDVTIDESAPEGEHLLLRIAQR